MQDGAFLEVFSPISLAHTTHIHTTIKLRNILKHTDNGIYSGKNCAIWYKKDKVWHL